MRSAAASNSSSTRLFASSLLIGALISAATPALPRRASSSDSFTPPASTAAGTPRAAQRASTLPTALPLEKDGSSSSIQSSAASLQKLSEFHGIQQSVHAAYAFCPAPSTHKSPPIPMQSPMAAFAALAMHPRNCTAASAYVFGRFRMPSADHRNLGFAQTWVQVLRIHSRNARQILRSASELHAGCIIKLHAQRPQAPPSRNRAPCSPPCRAEFRASPHRGRGGSARPH